ncbi:hypothetical protein BDQ12DRAFT_669654 [Crucibulum laeve]|uniref:Uncharacterized protein n=1 Tax=Crucibulum laeve TaxID=68775 RepID=A0A5C3LN02_9AGAR|nr:hypothetical protein BDQ12DRAFT_669654 [Crucibulum laeve]
MASTQKRLVLQYDTERDELAPWKWPVGANGEHLTPCDLQNHRETHVFLSPGCFCSLKLSLQLRESQGAAAPTPSIFIEALIYRVRGRSAWTGEYVASCALDICGYFVPLERLYGRFGIPIRRYPSRTPGNIVPPAPLHASEETNVHNANKQPYHASKGLEEAQCHNPLKRTYAMLDINDGVFHIGNNEHPVVERQTDLGLLMKINVWKNPGITETEF